MHTNQTKSQTQSSLRVHSSFKKNEITRKKTFLLNKRNPTNVKAQKLKKDQRKLTKNLQKEQAEYIQNQINKIKKSVD